MFHDDDTAATTPPKGAIIPGEDLDALSLEDLAERRAVLEAELRRIDTISEKKRAGRSEADAVFKF